MTRSPSRASHTVPRVSNDIQSVALGAEQLSVSVDAISQRVSHVAGIVGQTVEQAQRTGRIVAGLSEQATQIGDVVGLISGIAAQTNLLALNATIAAAGEERSVVTREMSGSMQAASHGVAAIWAGMETIAGASVRVDRATRQVREAARAIN